MTAIPEDTPLVRQASDLIEYFESGMKSPADLRVGAEFELIGVREDNAEQIPYFGSGGVRNTLEALAQRHGWKPASENGNVVGLEKGGCGVSIEPGGQVELATRPSPDIAGIRAELDSFAAQLRAVSPGVAWLGIGFTPRSALCDISRVPKARYGIMEPYMETVGSMGRRMMKQTASVQVALDYTSENDAADALRAALALAPVVTAMFANSTVAGGEIVNYRTLRSRIWDHTDAARCGFIACMLQPGAGFAQYTEYALDVPMYFLRRGGRYVNATSRTFRRFMAEGLGEHRATRGDWEDHLSTIFTEARLKTYVEVRSADAPPPALALTVPALWKGLLYGDGARREALALLEDISLERLRDVKAQVAENGLGARWGKTLLVDIARGLVRIAGQALDLAADRAALEPLEALILGRGVCPADDTRTRFTGEWKRELAPLVDAHRS